MSILLQVNPGPLYSRSKPVRDPKYLRYIRQFPCVGCKTTRRSRDAMHTGAHGIGQKASDLDALPGCRPCHQELHKIGPVKFQYNHKIDFPALQRMFRRLFRLKFPDHETPEKTPIQLMACECGYEDFREEFEIAGCPMCGKKTEEKAA